MHETFGFVVAASARPRSEKNVRGTSVTSDLNNQLYKTNTDVRIFIVRISMLTTAPDRSPAQQGNSPWRG